MIHLGIYPYEATPLVYNSLVIIHYSTCLLFFEFKRTLIINLVYLISIPSCYNHTIIFLNIISMCCKQLGYSFNFVVLQFFNFWFFSIAKILWNSTTPTIYSQILWNHLVKPSACQKLSNNTTYINNLFLIITQVENIHELLSNLDI